MRHKNSRTRFALFGALAAAVLVGLLTLAWVKLGPQMHVEPWTAYLGENERASLRDTVAPEAAGPGPDANLMVSGITFRTLQTMRRGNGDLSLFEVDPGVDTSDRPLRALIAHWKHQGLTIAIHKENTLTATNETGTMYSIRRVIADGTPRLLVWRFRAEASKEAPAPGARGDVLPPLPKGGDNMELGVPGRAGYTQIFTVQCDPRLAFRVVNDELSRRGWAPFKEIGPMGSPTGVPFQGSLAAVLRHKDAPLGCHLMIAAHPTRADTSQAFVALF